MVKYCTKGHKFDVPVGETFTNCPKCGCSLGIKTTSQVTREADDDNEDNGDIASIPTLSKLDVEVDIEPMFERQSFKSVFASDPREYVPPAPRKMTKKQIKSRQQDFFARQAEMKRGEIGGE